MAAVLLTASITNATASIASCLCSAEAATMTLASPTGTVLSVEERHRKVIVHHAHWSSFVVVQGHVVYNMYITQNFIYTSN